MRRFVCAAAALLALCFAIRHAEADTKSFENPQFGGNRLDWCVNWGTGCGEPAATAWCKSIGYDVAIEAKPAVDIGASTPTKLIATGEVCDQSYCDGFASITCATVALPAVPPPAPVEATEAPSTPAPPPAVETSNETFKNPMHEGVRLNWCFSGESGCGIKTAEAWCAQQGFSTAKDFKYVSGVKPTIQIGTGKTTKKAAKGFSRVTCVK